MNLVNMLTRRDPLKRAFVTLEDGMTDILNEEFMLPPEPVTSLADDDDPFSVDLDPEAGSDPTVPTHQTEDVGERVTAHTQRRLAGYAAFDTARAKTGEDLGRISQALASVIAAHHQGREFVDDCHADIHRSNDLEVANANLSADNRRLTERVDKLEKLRGRYDLLIEVLKRRESRHLQEAETMRESLGTLKLEVVEARNMIARNESLSGDLQAALAAKTSESERFMRDSELLRERNVGLVLELDLAQKKQSETRRKLEELNAVNASDSARLAEIAAKLASEVNETLRLQKLADSLEARLVEASENAGHLSSELADREKRYQSENQALRVEMQSLNARLQHAASEQRDTGVEVTTLRSKLSDLEAERHILEKKNASLAGELETERRMGAAQAGLVQAPREQVSVDLHRRQTEQMRAEIAALQETVGQLRQYENIYTAAKARARAKSEVASGFSVENGKIVPEFAPPRTTLARSA